MATRVTHTRTKLWTDQGALWRGQPVSSGKRLSQVGSVRGSIQVSTHLSHVHYLRTLVTFRQLNEPEWLAFLHSEHGVVLLAPAAFLGLVLALRLARRWREAHAGGTRCGDSCTAGLLGAEPARRMNVACYCSGASAEVLASVHLGLT